MSNDQKLFLALWLGGCGWWERLLSCYVAGFCGHSYGFIESEEHDCDCPMGQGMGKGLTYVSALWFNATM